MKNNQSKRWAMDFPSFKLLNFGMRMAQYDTITIMRKSEMIKWAT